MAKIDALYIILGILIVGGIVVLILYLTGVIGKRKKKKGPVGSAGNWSAHQKATLLALIEKHAATDPTTPQFLNSHVILTCMVNEVAANYSYSEANSSKFSPNDQPAMIRKCLGVKGHWSNALKSGIISDIEQEGLSKSCAICTIGALEKDYSPMDFIKMVKNPNTQAPLQKIVKQCDCQSSNPHEN